MQADFTPLARKQKDKNRLRNTPCKSATKSKCSRRRRRNKRNNPLIPAYSFSHPLPERKDWEGLPKTNQPYSDDSKPQADAEGKSAQKNKALELSLPHLPVPKTNDQNPCHSQRTWIIFTVQNRI